MKSLVIFLTVALVSLIAANEQSNELDIPIEFHRCIAQTGITTEQLLKHYRGQRSDEKEVHDYVLCILRQSDFFTEEKGFNAEQMVARLKSSHLDDGKARELAAKCIDRNEQGSTPAEWGYRVMQCLIDNKMAELLIEARRKLKESNNEKNV